MTTTTVEGLITDGNIINEHLGTIWRRLGSKAVRDGETDFQATMRAIRLASMPSIDPNEVTVEQLMSQYGDD